jgi:hypothetical protein
MSSSSRYAIVFGLLAAICSIGAFSSPLLISLLLAMSAAASLLVAVAYCWRKPQLLGKSHNGRLSVRSIAALLPYHVLNQLAFATYCRLDRTPPWQEIVPGLYLGRRLVAREASLMPAKHILDLTSEFPEPVPLRGRDYSNVPMLDGVAPTISQLSEAVDSLRASMREGATFVHCALGHGRSATVAAAFLLAEGHAATVDDAICIVRSKRPSVRLSRGQRRVLATWKERSPT